MFFSELILGQWITSSKLAEIKSCISRYSKNNYYAHYITKNQNVLIKQLYCCIAKTITWHRLHTKQELLVKCKESCMASRRRGLQCETSKVILIADQITVDII